MPRYEIYDPEIDPNDSYMTAHRGARHHYTLVIEDVGPVEQRTVRFVHCDPNHRLARNLDNRLLRESWGVLTNWCDPEKWLWLDLALDHYPSEVGIRIRFALATQVIQNVPALQYYDMNSRFNRCIRTYDDLMAAELHRRYNPMTGLEGPGAQSTRIPQRDPVTGRFTATVTDSLGIWPPEFFTTNVNTSTTQVSANDIRRAAGLEIVIWRAADRTVLTEDDNCFGCGMYPEPDDGLEWYLAAEAWSYDHYCSVNDALVCDSCKSEFLQCELAGCHVVSNTRDSVRTDRSRVTSICTSQVHDDFYYCEFCENYIEDHNWDGHMDYCLWCVENAEPHEDCEDCDTNGPEHDYGCECDPCVYYEGDDDYSEDCECGGCIRQRHEATVQRTLEERETIRRGVRNYSYRPEFFAFPSGEPVEGSSQLLIGMELEVSFKPPYDAAVLEWYPKWKDVDINGQFKEFLYLKSDSSVTNGFEIVTMPFEPQWGLENVGWDLMFGELIDKFGAHEEHRTCGQHIHISKKAFDMAHFWKFVQFHQKLANFCGQIGGRGTNSSYGSFEGRSWKEMTTILKELSKKKGEYGRGMYNWYPERYSALNVEPTSTLEMRYPAGNIKPSNIKKNIQWVLSVFEYTNYIDVKDVQDGAIDTPNNYLWFIKNQPQRFEELIAYLELIIPQPKPLRERS